MGRPLGFEQAALRTTLRLSAPTCGCLRRRSQVARHGAKTVQVSDNERRVLMIVGPRGALPASRVGRRDVVLVQEPFLSIERHPVLGHLAAVGVRAAATEDHFARRGDVGEPLDVELRASDDAARHIGDLGSRRVAAATSRVGGTQHLIDTDSVLGGSCVISEVAADRDRCRSCIAGGCRGRQCSAAEKRHLFGRREPDNLHLRT